MSGARPDAAPGMSVFRSLLKETSYSRPAPPSLMGGASSSDKSSSAKAVAEGIRPSKWTKPTQHKVNACGFCLTSSTAITLATPIAHTFLSSSRSVIFKTGAQTLTTKFVNKPGWISLNACGIALEAFLCMNKLHDTTKSRCNFGDFVLCNLDKSTVNNGLKCWPYNSKGKCMYIAFSSSNAAPSVFRLHNTNWKRSRIACKCERSNSPKAACFTKYARNNLTRPGTFACAFQSSAVNSRANKSW
mmetsp:Transcript_71148/g.206035  ORF Transcript_71148/g.206035 Transcript_71148/m.206035 type:complete len:245 (-) Transcript_71148:2118-2852(-)